ncbi:MAG: hypothetical protein WBN04_07130 [Paracoccaceae bacterium]
MDRTETIQRVRGAIAREIGVPVEQTRTDVGLTELARLDGFFEEEDIVDVVERELAVCADVIWDGYPQRDRRAEGRIAIVARSLRLLAPFDRRAEDMLPHYAGRYEDPSIDSIAESLIAGRYVRSDLDRRNQAAKPRRFALAGWWEARRMYGYHTTVACHLSVQSRLPEL